MPLWFLAIFLSRILACLVYILILESLAIVLLWILACLSYTLTLSNLFLAKKSASLSFGNSLVLDIGLYLSKGCSVSPPPVFEHQDCSGSSLSSSLVSLKSPWSIKSFKFSGLYQVLLKPFKSQWSASTSLSVLPSPRLSEALQVHRSKSLHHPLPAKPLKFAHPRLHSQSPRRSPWLFSIHWENSITLKLSKHLNTTWTPSQHSQLFYKLS